MSENQSRGQDILSNLSKYFGGNKKQDTGDRDPENITLQDAPKNIRTVDRYFKGDSYEFEIFLALLLPAIMIILFLVFTRNKSGKTIDIEKLSKKDFDFIEVVRLQKGLEEFDRDFLLQLAYEYALKPVYQILIDKDAYEKIENEIISDIALKGESVNSNKRVRYLRKLKLKLF
jgi:hypothetical protein